MIKRVLALVVAVCFLFTIVGCGGTVKAPADAKGKVKFARVVDEGSIAGICSGLAYVTGTPVWCWRTGFVTVVLLGGAGILVYVILWMFMPKYDKTPFDFFDRTQ